MLNRNDYLILYNSAKVTEDKLKSKILDSVCQVILFHREIYMAVEDFTYIPWPIIAAIHFREGDQNFETHLHNGDSLKQKTIRVPKGRPEWGSPPFTWIESACDALSTKTWIPYDWDMANCLEYLERYNGLGYQKKGVHSPYLWDYTDQYLGGLYRSDGQFDPNAKENRPGCVAILKRLEQKGVSLDFTGMGANGNPIH